MGIVDRELGAPFTFDSTTTLNELVERLPATHRVLSAHGLDTCCGGALPLEEAARRHGIALPGLLEELRRAAVAE